MKFHITAKILENFPKQKDNNGQLLSYFSSYFKIDTIYHVGTRPIPSESANFRFTFIPTSEKILFHHPLLSSPFLYLKTEEHDGHTELKMIQQLWHLDYQGFIICDNIWAYKEMRDNFWYKIEDKYRYDLTDLGHSTGTGIVTFNKSNIFHKYDLSDWTLVTAYFNLTKCSDASAEIHARDSNYYMSHSLSTLNLPHNLVIYCDAESLDKIRKLRPEYLEYKTRYIVWDFDEIVFKSNGVKGDNFSRYRKKIIQNRIEKPYQFDPRNTASYYLFCMSRYAMLKDAIEKNWFGSTHYCWINFCIERMGYNNLVRLEEALAVHRDKFSTCYIDYIPEQLVKNTADYFQWGRCSMCSGFFTGNSEYMYKVCDLIEKKFLQYLELGYGHADEQLYSPVYYENPDLFEHYYGDYQQMITNYKYVYEAPYPPLYNFIHNSFVNTSPNYAKCWEACEFLYRSWAMDKCEMSQKNLYDFFYYYMFCKKELGK